MTTRLPKKKWRHIAADGSLGHVAAAPTHGRRLDCGLLGQAKPALPVDYADALSCSPSAFLLRKPAL